MNKTKWSIAAGLAALLLAGAFVWSHLQPYSHSIDHGPSPEALRNPYLAAQMFLQAQGLPTQLANGLQVLDSLPPAGHSLLMLGERRRLSPRQVEQVLEWVRQGGRLLVVAEALWDERTGHSGDLLLERLNIRQMLSADLPPLPLAPLTGPDLTRLYLENESAPAYFGFDPGLHLEDPDNRAQSWANSRAATHLMQMNHGRGLITVVSDAALWQNAALHEYDNAWLLWYLNQGTEVTVLLNADPESLFTLLMRHFPQALVALVLLLALTAWHFALRQGPMRPAPVLARRQLQEHLLATADFQWRQGGQAQMLRVLQHDILRRARHRHPGFEKLPVAEQWQVLARLSGQPTRAVSQALLPRTGQRASPGEFSRQVAQLQTLKNAL